MSENEVTLSKGRLEELERIEKAARAYADHWTTFSQPVDWEDHRNRLAFELLMAAYPGTVD